MLISLEWISQFTDILDIKPEILADRLTMATAEVEGLHTIERFTENVLIGTVQKVRGLEKENLKLVTVDCKDRVFETVCGAPNVKEGMKSFFAPAGTLVNNFKVKETKIAGHISAGILCSASELGFGAFHEGIMEIPDSTENGIYLAEIVPKKDTLIEIDNKSLTHRPDLWGHYGFAREIAAIFKKELKPLSLEDLTVYDNLPKFPLKVEDKDGCPCYCCMKIGGLASVPSPIDIQYRLLSIGQRPVSLLVDITNYIMFEIGQPMHAFDAGSVKALSVARFKGSKPFATLDEKTHKLNENNLMICDESGPIGIAGVMGGLESEVKQDTGSIVLESANFKGASIRRTAMQIGARTEASQRFEKEQPRANCKIGIMRFLSLAKQAGLLPKALSSLTIEGDLKEDIRYINLSKGALRKKVGIDIPAKKVKELLCSIGFEVSEEEDGVFKVGAPPYRSEKDISIPEDIVEEITRLYGYDNIQPDMPFVKISPLLFNQRLLMEHKLRKILAYGHNFAEVQSYAWFDDNWLKALEYDPGQTLVLKNPTAPFQSRLRTFLAANMFAVIKQNQAYEESFKIFEIGKVYLPTDTGRDEFTNICCAICQPVKTADIQDLFLQAKGVLQDIIEKAGGVMPKLKINTEGKSLAKTLPPGRIEVEASGKTAGVIDIASEAIRKQVSPEHHIAWFELILDVLEPSIYPKVDYQQSSRYPGSWLDFSILWNPEKTFAALEDKLNEFSDPLILERQFMYMYKGKGLPQGTASYTFRYKIGSNEKTLAGKEIEDIHLRLTDFLKTQGIELR